MCDWGSQVEKLYVVLWEEYEEWENKTLKGSYHYIFIIWHNVVFTFHSTSSSLCCVCLSRIKLPNNKRETHLLLLLAFGLLLGWVWYRDVQWSLQGCQVIAAERRLTGNTMLLRPTFSSTDALFFLFFHTIMLLSRKGTGSLQEMKDPCTAPPYNTFNSICSSSIFWGKNFETSPSACYQENNNNHVTSSNKLQFMGKLWKICIYGINYLLGEILTEVIHLQRRD